jgi:preprotein translocase subunit YajC
LTPHCATPSISILCKQLGEESVLKSLVLAGQAAAKSAPQNQMQMMILMIGVIFILLYFVVLRPQKQEQKKQEDLRNAVKKGDKIVTIGGIHGMVTGVDTTRDTVSVQVDRNVKIDFAKSAIATITRKEDLKEAEEGKNSS